MDAPRPVKALTLVATALGSALAFLDTTVVIVALPQMEADLGLGLSGQQWVYLSYALSLSAFYLVAARRTMGPGADARVPRAAKIIATTSVVMWVAIIVCGRLITFYRPGDCGPEGPGVIAECIPRARR